MNTTFFGHLLVHFVEDPAGYGERIFLSRSAGPDARRWERLNAGRPILQSTVGTTGVRDPFLVRTRNGFVLLATDLRIYGGDDAGWDAWQRHGSRSLVVWESADLLTWSRPRLAEVAPPAAGMAWAPEVALDPVTGDHLVFWSSTLYAADDIDHADSSYSRILASRTTDFRSFSAPEILVDEGVPVIDMTVAVEGSVIHRFLKEDAYDVHSRRLYQQVGSTFFAPRFDTIATRIGEDRHTRVEGPIVFRDLHDPIWYLFVDQFDRPPQGYVAYWTENLGSGEWNPIGEEEFQLPPATKHGSVIPVTRDEWDRVGAMDIDLTTDDAGAA